MTVSVTFSAPPTADELAALARTMIKWLGWVLEEEEKQRESERKGGKTA